MNLNDKADMFFDLHRQDHAFVMPNPWDIGSARIMAGMGFKALATTSSGLALTQGRDDGWVKRDDVLSHAREICAATDLPVSADLENCFGHSPEEVAETITLAGDTGLVGGSVEDYSDDPDYGIYDQNLATERVIAAVEAAAKLPFKFTVTARAENLIRNNVDLDDTINRLQAYEAAGADVLYAPGLKDVETVQTVCSALTQPVNVLAMRSGTTLTVAEISQAGGKRISLGGTLAVAVTGALMQMCSAILEDGNFALAREFNSHSKGYSKFLIND